MDENDQITEQDDNLFDEDTGADDFDAKLRDDIEALIGDDGEDDDAGLDAPMDEPDATDNRVGPEEGAELASDARMKGKTGADKVETKGGEEKPEGEEADADADPDKAEKGDKPETEEKGDDDLTAKPVADLLKDVPEAQRGEIGRRLSEAEAMMAPFQTDYAKAELARHGAKPQDAMARLVELNQFAQSKPDEYLAWVASEVGGDTPHTVLEGAAKHLGYKLVKDGGEGEEDEDLFLDDTTRAIKEENERLKRQLNGDAPNFGPDTAERRAQRQAQAQLQSFLTETDEAGQPKRPYFNQLQGRITELAQTHATNTGQPVTVDDLGRFYDAAVAEAQQIAGGGNTSAAPSSESVATQNQNKAAAAERARKASKSVDGTGQGASRRPALPDNAPIEDVIRAQLSKYS